MDAPFAFLSDFSSPAPRVVASADRCGQASRFQRAMLRPMMTAAVSIGLGLATVVAFAAPARGQGPAADAPAEIEHPKYHFEGQVTTPTEVKSGVGGIHYATQRLDRGTTVVVVGKQGEWLKIKPPEGSFSLVKKLNVSKYGDGKVGKITDSAQTIHAGSTLQPGMQWAVQCKMEVGQDVTIYGEINEYYKIKPPENAYLYVHQDAVTPVRSIARTADGADSGPPASSPIKPSATGPAAEPFAVGTGAPDRIRTKLHRI